MSSEDCIVPPIANVVALRTKRLSKRKLDHIEESIEQVKQTKRDYCDEILEFSMEQLVSCLHSFGTFQDSSRVTQKDMILLEQSLQSVLYRYNGLVHPLHTVVEDLIHPVDEQDAEDESIET
jgi:hypothetical protein